MARGSRRTVRIGALAAGAWTCLWWPLPSEGQTSTWVGVRLERAPASVPADGFPGRSAPELSVVAGIALDARHGLELAVGRLDAARTQTDWTPLSGEAPYTVGLRAWPVTASWVIALPRRDAPFGVFAEAGATWIRVRDRWMSDTPEESASTSLVGGHAGGGVALRPVHGARVSLRAAYRAFGHREGRPWRAVELDGWAVGATLAVAF